MSKALRNYGTRNVLTPATAPIPKSTQVANWGGGFSWEVDDFTKLQRFLILGIEGGTMYASESKLVKYNGDAVIRAIEQDGMRVVREIVAVSDGGRAIKNDPALFALAIAASKGDEETRKAAFAVLPQVARTGTHLLHFAEYLKGFRGKGRAYRNGIGGWFNNKPVGALAYQMVKYRQRDGWTQADLLRVAHPKTDDPERNALYKWVVDGGETLHNTELSKDGSLKILFAYEAAQRAKDAKEIIKLIRDYNLPREAIPTNFLNDKGVWEALLVDMPMTALVRNLGKLSSIGLLAANSNVARAVVEQLNDEVRVRKARIHPIQALVAMKVYEQGHGEKGNLSWSPVRKVVDALDGLFYTAFGNVEPTNKSITLAVDISGSMTYGNLGGMPGITPAIGASAMALVTAAVEPNAEIIGFGSSVRPINISPRERLDDVISRMSFSMGSTNCALPMQYANQNGWNEVDAFVIYTDSEVNTGHHAAELTRQYRTKNNRQTKMVVVAMEANGFSIADPNDPGMLDICGFDTSTPNAISAFIAS